MTAWPVIEHDPDGPIPCQHENFAAHADVARLTNTEGGPVEGYSLELRVECADCREPFCFRAPMGVSQFAPTASLDGTVLTAPIHPMSDPTAGIGLPAGMRHSRDAARHALYAAVHDGLMRDPLSKAVAR